MQIEEGMEGESVAGSFRVMSAATLSSVYHENYQLPRMVYLYDRTVMPMLPRGGPSNPPAVIVRLQSLRHLMQVAVRSFA